MSDTIRPLTVARDKLARALNGQPEVVRAIEQLIQRVGQEDPAEMAEVSAIARAALSLAGHAMLSIGDAQTDEPWPMLPQSSAGGALASVIYGQAVIDFGASFVAEKTFTVTDPDVVPTSVIQCFMQGDSTADNSAASHLIGGRSFRFTATPGSGSFSLDAVCLIGMCAGTFKIRYSHA